MDVDSLKEWAAKLSLLLDDPQPGLFTWQSALGDHMKFFVDEWYKSAPKGTMVMSPGELREIVMSAWVAGWYSSSSTLRPLDCPRTDEDKRGYWIKLAKKLGIPAD
jgi:hypothetical protein